MFDVLVGSIRRHFIHWFSFGRRFVVSLVATGTIVAVAGCSSVTQSSGSIDNPINRRLTYFSFLNGDDIRASCASGVPDRARMVLNGRYRDQVRVYDFRPDLHKLDVAVYGVMSLKEIELSSPFGPWQGVSVPVSLNEGDNAALWMSLENSGAFAAPPVGEVLKGDHLFWTVVGCRGGKVFFNAWQYPSPRWASAGFRDELMRRDPTGIGFPALEEPLIAGMPGGVGRDDPSFDFQLNVDDNGLNWLRF